MDGLPIWAAAAWGLLVIGALFHIGAKLDQIIALLRDRQN